MVDMNHKKINSNSNTDYVHKVHIQTKKENNK
jgi:hypothetical protein